MPAYLRLTGGVVYDPANSTDGEVRDIWIQDGQIVSPPEPHLADDNKAIEVTTIDASGRVIFPGGVDMHCHIAGPKVNTARKMQPEDARRSCESDDGSLASVPDIVTTGLRYTGLGYTTCFDAAVTPLACRHVHHEFDQLPNVDRGFYVLIGNNHYAMQCVADQDQAALEAFLGWILSRTGAYAPKLVNPGGVEMWKQRANGNATDLEASFVLEALCQNPG